MYINYRKSNRVFNKFFIKNQSSFKNFTKFFNKNSYNGYNKLTPHKIKSKKSKKYILLQHTNTLLMNFVFLKTLSFESDDSNGRVYRLNMTDLGHIFLTPGILTSNILLNLNFSNFLVTSKLLGLHQKKYKTGDVISNITPNLLSGLLCSARGSKALVTKVVGDTIKIVLPSGFERVSAITSSYSGQNAKVNSYKNFRALRVKLYVRGIAKNPVDHPNGGRSNTKGSFKTPWGLIAKKGK